MTLARYQGRFGGVGTIVTLADGRAFTAAHCVAKVDGGRGTVLTSVDGRQWRVVRRWSPRGRDLAQLQALDAAPAPAGVLLASHGVLQPGIEIAFHGYNGRQFERRRAVVVDVTATHATAAVRSRAGVGDGDSGGPVLASGRLAGIVVARAGGMCSSRASSLLVLTRLDRPGT